MKKPTPAALSAFDRVFPDDARATRKKMFGMPAGFVNGNMFLGVWADGVVLRMPAERRVELADREGIGPFEPMHGRPWKEYLHAATPTWGESAELAQWAVEALEHTARMPPKAKKARKPKK